MEDDGSVLFGYRRWENNSLYYPCNLKVKNPGGGSSPLPHLDGESQSSSPPLMGERKKLWTTWACFLLI